MTAPRVLFVGGRAPEEALALLSDAARREAFGRAARERVLAFDWSAVLRRTAEVHAALAPRT